MHEVAIMGIDPGNETGLVVWQGDTWTDHYSVPAADAVFTAWDFMIRMHDRIVVCCEHFSITERTLRATRQPDALHVTGAVRFYAERLHIPFINSYKPAETMRLITDDLLRRFGLWIGTGHTRDALRQVLFHIATTDRPQFERLYRAAR